MSGPTGEGGLSASLHRLAATALGLVHSRLELLATELEEEKVRLGGVLWFGIAAFFFLGFGVVLLALTLTVLFWDSHRLLGLAVFTTVFLVLGVVAVLLARRYAAMGRGVFSASLAELHRDREAVDPQRPGQ
ncbi:MAG: phage holin family protein [Betaproteobacteria bacterium]|nr:phage holin family protein [Betaproteobacteria bacterium]